MVGFNFQATVSWLPACYIQPTCLHKETDDNLTEQVVPLILT